MILHLVDYNIRNPSEKSENSIQSKNEKKLNLKLISYYHILSDNKNIINFDFNNEVKELNNLMAIFVKNKDYDKCIKLLNFLDNKFISHIKKETFHQMIKEFSFDKVERIKNHVWFQNFNWEQLIEINMKKKKISKTVLD